MKKLLAGLLAVSLMGNVVAAEQDKSRWVPKAPTPIGYDKHMNYVANGLFDPTVPPADTNLINCDPVLHVCDGMYFQKHIMGRTDAQIAEREEQAKAFFIERFGMDLDAEANAGRLMLMNFMIDPRFNLHMIHSSGDRVPRKGWQMRDGGFMAVVLDPNGFAMGGDSAGKVAPAGSFVLFAEYNVKTSYLNLSDDKIADTKTHTADGLFFRTDPIILQIRSINPQPPGQNGFQCELFNDEFGHGLVQGWAQTVPTADGLIKYNISGDLSFPGMGDVPLIN